MGFRNIKKFATVCKAIPFPAEEVEQFVKDFIKDLLSDPQSVYSYVNSLQSTKKAKKHLEGHKERILKELNDLPRHREALNHMYEQGHMDIAEYDEKMAKANKLEVDLRKDLSGIEKQIGEDKISDIYGRTFKEFAKEYKPFLDGTMKDPQEVSNLIHLIVDRIHVYTRKRNEKDVIAGRKKLDQEIPHQIRIDLRLPHDIMLRMAQEGKFEVRNHKL